MGSSRKDDIEVKTKFVTDTASLNTLTSSATKATGALDDLEARNEQLDVSAHQAALSMSELDKETVGLRRHFKGTIKDAQELSDGYEELRQDVLAYGDAEEQIRQQAGGVTAPGGLDTGARASRLRDVGGGVAALGGEQFERLTFVAADIMDASEAFGELAPNLLKSKAGAIGLGVAAVGLGIGLVALAAVFAESHAQGKLVADQIRATITAQRDALDFARTATTAELNARREAAQTSLDASRAELDRIRTVRAGIDEQLSDMGFFTGAIVTLTQGTENALAALGEAEQKAAEETANLEAELLQLGTAGVEVSVAANDATAALEALSQATTDSLLRSVQDEIDLRELAARSQEMTASAIRDEIAATERVIETRQIAIDRLIASGDASEEAARQLTQYIEAQTEATMALSSLRLALPGAEELEMQNKLADSRMQAAISQKQYAQEALAQTEAMAKQRAAIEKKLADQIISITQRAADAARETRIGLERELASLTTGAGRDIAGMERDTRREDLEIVLKDQRDAEKSLRQHLRTMQKLRRDSENQEAELIQMRDFRGLFNLRRNTRKRIEEESNNFTDQENERQIALSQERADNIRHFNIARADRMTALKQEISDAQAAAAVKLSDINRLRNIELSRLRQSANEQLSILSQTESAKVAIVQQGAAAVKGALASMFAGLPSGKAFKAAVMSNSNVTMMDNSKNTFNTGASAQAVKKLVDSRIVRNLKVVLKK